MRLILSDSGKLRSPSSNVLRRRPDTPGTGSSQYPRHRRRMNIEKPRRISGSFCPAGYHRTISSCGTGRSFGRVGENLLTGVACPAVSNCCKATLFLRRLRRAAPTCVGPKKPNNRPPQRIRTYLFRIQPKAGFVAVDLELEKGVRCAARDFEFAVLFFQRAGVSLENDQEIAVEP